MSSAKNQPAMNQPVVLYENEFLHVVDNETGSYELIEGPCRSVLPPSKTISGKKEQKVVLKQGQYMIVSCPYDKQTKKNLMGEREVRVGPCTFSRYPHELFGQTEDAIILTQNQAVIVLTKKAHDGKKAGERTRIKGPILFIPHKYDEILKRVDAVSVPENEAIYIQNTDTGKLSMISGPVSYIPDTNEELFNKGLTTYEYSALEMSENPSYKAITIQVQKNEVICVVDHAKNTEKYVFGPLSYILKENEGLKVLSLSAGVPKIEDQMKVAVLRLGPDFMDDSFEVSTKDNAILQIVVTYKWKFIVDERDTEKIFHGDFIGFSAQSLRSRIREEASNHDFEHFHTNASDLLRKRLFKDYDVEYKPLNATDLKQEHLYGRYFREFSLFIFGLDVKRITPVDKEIEKLLEESIKASMTVLCRKLNDSAGFESEKEEIESETETEKLKKNLIEIQHQNYTKEKIEKAKIEGNALIEASKSEAEAEMLLMKSRADMEIEQIESTLALMKGSGGDSYIQYLKFQNLGDNVDSMVVVPQDTKTLFIPNSGMGSRKAIGGPEDIPEIEETKEEEENSNY